MGCRGDHLPFRLLSRTEHLPARGHGQSRVEPSGNRPRQLRVPELVDGNASKGSSHLWIGCGLRLYQRDGRGECLLHASLHGVLDRNGSEAPYAARRDPDRRNQGSGFFRQNSNDARVPRLVSRGAYGCVLQSGRGTVG
jgi:hypothetical protein